MTTSSKTFYEQEIERIYSETPLQSKHYLLIRQSKAFMAKHHSEKIDLDALAKSAFMSRFHYARIFKQIYGVTPRNYLKDLRINQAKKLLKQGGSITQTCLDVGYDSLTTFCNAFKKATGCTPKEFQKLYQSNLE